MAVLITVNSAPITANNKNYKIMFPLPLFYYFEFMAFIASLIFLNNSKNKSLQWFRYYLFFIILVELTARYIRKVHHEPNVWLYNFSIPVEYLFYTIIFYFNYRLSFNKHFAKWFLILFFGFVIINLSVIQGIGTFNSFTVLIGSFFMILLSAMMLYDMLIGQEGNNILLKPLFWIAIGVLLFNAGEFTYDVLSNYLINAEIDKAASFFAKINNKLILVLYSCLTIGFICSKITGIYRKE